MHLTRQVGLSMIVGAGAMLGVGWLGLRVQSPPFPRYPERAVDVGAVSLPADLPAPVDRYFRTVLGDRVPTIRSAVLSGRGWLRFGGLTFPSRFRFTHEAGRGYRHYIECTWFGLPVLRVNETYLNGRARLALPFGVVADEPKVDLAANLALWSESFWLPSILVTDPRLRWEAIDQTHAALIVPAGESEDRLALAFDDQTGLLRRIEASRYRDASDASRTPWLIEPLAWRTFDGVRIPSQVAITWLDEGRPWLAMTIEDAVYNVDVSAYIRSSAP